ncbi:hypothetical protein Tco_1519079 [Tanacetum coccineum]
MVDIPDDIDLVDYNEEDHEEDPEEDPEEEPEEDVDIKIEDDAELIFPYEVEGDKTLPPGDVSSDSESEDKEVDVAPEDTLGTITQKPYVIRDFPRGLFEVGEPSSARDSSHVDGLAPVPWACMERDIAERRLHESRVWNKMFYLDMVRIGAVLKPPSDDEDTERPRKKSKNFTSDGTEGPSEPHGPPIELVFWSCITLDGDMIMPPKAMSEARMREVIREQVATSIDVFMANMNREADGDEVGGAGAGGAGVGGAGPATPKITGCTYVTFMKCDPQPFKGTEDAMGLCQWFEKLESVFRISDCKERDKVKFTTATLQGRALT